MAYNEKLADRIREELADRKHVEEKKIMGGLCFLYKGKMCCGIVKDDMMVRVIERKAEAALSHRHVREMDFTGRPLKGFVYVSPDGYKKIKDLSYWVDIGIEFVDSLPPEKFKQKVKKKTSKKVTKKISRKSAPKKDSPKKKTGK